jgi:hypothetical protein
MATFWGVAKGRQGHAPNPWPAIALFITAKRKKQWFTWISSADNPADAVSRSQKSVFF